MTTDELMVLAKNELNTSPNLEKLLTELVNGYMTGAASGAPTLETLAILLGLI